MIETHGPQPGGVMEVRFTGTVTGTDYDEIMIPALESAIEKSDKLRLLCLFDADFEAFADIVRRMRRKEHLTPEGFEYLVRRAFSMNKNGKQRARTLEEVLAGSSETARQAPAPTPRDR